MMFTQNRKIVFWINQKEKKLLIFININNNLQFALKIKSYRFHIYRQIDNLKLYNNIFFFLLFKLKITLIRKFKEKKKSIIERKKERKEC